MTANLMNGTYYEFIDGFGDIHIVNANMDDAKAKHDAMNTEQCVYKNTYENGKRIESVKLHDPYDDGYFQVGGDYLYYEPLPEEMRFRYSMLGRLKSDCDYFLDCGHGYEGNLWAGSVEGQIKEMRDRWNSFEDDEKPEWLTMEQIDDYEQRMLAKKRERTA